MTSPDQKGSEEGLNLVFFTIPQQLLLQLSSGSLLLALLGSKAASETMRAIGEASEELFRGDRLPVIKFPVESEDR